MFVRHYSLLGLMRIFPSAGKLVSKAQGMPFTAYFWKCNLVGTTGTRIIGTLSVQSNPLAGELSVKPCVRNSWPPTSPTWF